MRWLGLVLLLAACGQDESFFQNPTPTELGKDPYDFSTLKYPRDFSATIPEVLDLSVPPDLPNIIVKPDLTSGDNHDLTM